MNPWILQPTYRDIKNLLARGAQEMKSAIFCHAALMDSRGQLVHVEGPQPLHYFGFTQTIPAINKYFKLGPEDILVTNDPAFGSPRLCDVNFISAIYRGKEIKGYAVAQISLAELTFTSKIFDATKLDDEGYKIPPTPLDAAGMVQSALLDFLMASGADRNKLSKYFAEALAGLDKIKSGFSDLEKRWGKNQIAERFQGLQDYAEELLKHSLQRFPDGEYSSQLKMSGPSVLQTRVRVRDNHLTVDFLGTSKASPRAINIPYHLVLSCCYWFFMSLLEEEIPLNNGVLKAIAVEAPQGTLVNPPPNSACFEGYFYTSQMILANLKNLLAQALPRDAEESQMTPSLTMAIKFSKKIFFENFGCGTNASSLHPGVHCVKADITNLPTKTLESVEERFPIQFLSRGLRIAMEKPEDLMGGRGLSQSFKVLDDGVLKVLAGSHRNQQEVVIEKNGQEIHTQLFQYYPLNIGDVVKITTFNGYSRETDLES